MSKEFQTLLGELSFVVQVVAVPGVVANVWNVELGAEGRSLVLRYFGVVRVLVGVVVTRNVDIPFVQRSIVPCHIVGGDIGRVRLDGKFPLIHVCRHSHAIKAGESLLTLVVHLGKRTGVYVWDLVLNGAITVLFFAAVHSVTAEKVSSALVIIWDVNETLARAVGVVGPFGVGVIVAVWAENEVLGLVNHSNFVFLCNGRPHVRQCWVWVGFGGHEGSGGNDSRQHSVLVVRQKVDRKSDELLLFCYF